MIRLKQASSGFEDYFADLQFVWQNHDSGHGFSAAARVNFELKLNGNYYDTVKIRQGK